MNCTIQIIKNTINNVSWPQISVILLLMIVSIHNIQAQFGNRAIQDLVNNDLHYVPRSIFEEVPPLERWSVGIRLYSSENSNLLRGNRHTRAIISIKCLRNDVPAPIEYIEINNPYLGISRRLQKENPKIPNDDYYLDPKNKVRDDGTESDVLRLGNRFRIFRDDFVSSHLVRFNVKELCASANAFWCTRVRVKPLQGELIEFFLEDRFKLGRCMTDTKSYPRDLNCSLRKY